MALKQRKSPRLKEYDYSIPNYYFVTICVEGKSDLFGKVIGETVELNKRGIIVKECLLEIKEHFINVDIDEYIIMPNHFHVIIIFQDYVGLRSPQPINNDQHEINEERKMNNQPEAKTKHFSLSQIIAYFKYQSTKRINAEKEIKEKVWQRSFYDRIIRNEGELFNIRKYILQNPIKNIWKLWKIWICKKYIGSRGPRPYYAKNYFIMDNEILCFGTSIPITVTSIMSPTFNNSSGFFTNLFAICDM